MQRRPQQALQWGQSQPRTVEGGGRPSAENHSGLRFFTPSAACSAPYESSETPNGARPLSLQTGGGRQSSLTVHKELGPGFMLGHCAALGLPWLPRPELPGLCMPGRLSQQLLCFFCHLPGKWQRGSKGGHAEQSLRVQGDRGGKSSPATAEHLGLFPPSTSE